MNRQRASFVVALAILIASLSPVACGSTPTSPSGPVTPPPPPALVMAPPPAGVSAANWRVAFGSDGRLYRPPAVPPAPEAVHLDMSVFSLDVRSFFLERMSVAQGMVQGKTTFDLTPGGMGATITVSLTPGLTCGNFGLVAACTTLNWSSDGWITGGKMEFTSVTAMTQPRPVLHEILRTLGLTGLAPTGIMASPLQDPTDEDITMLRARYNFPLLAVYTDR